MYMDSSSDFFHNMKECIKMEINTKFPNKNFIINQSNRGFSLCEKMFETECFEIKKIENHYYKVILPMKNSTYSYSVHLEENENIKEIVMRHIDNHYNNIM